MRRRPVFIAGLALAALAAAGGATAYAAGSTPDPDATGTVEGKDGGIRRDGKDAITLIVTRDGDRVRIEHAAKARPGAAVPGCPVPGTGGKALGTLVVKDGRIYRDGKEVGRVHADGTGVQVLTIRDGEIRVSRSTEPPAHATPGDTGGARREPGSGGQADGTAGARDRAGDKGGTGDTPGRIIICTARGR